MNELNTIYQKHVEHELKLVVDPGHNLLNKEKVKIKVLAFLSELGTVGNESRCFSFWDKTENDVKELLDYYIDGLQLLLSIGFELQIDRLKNFPEINTTNTVVEQFIKVYQSVLKIQETYSFEDYQHSIDDYFTLGFKLGLDFDTIITAYKEHL